MSARPLVLQNARIVDPSRDMDEIGDVYLRDGVVQAAGRDAHNQGVEDGAERLSCDGLVVAPGLVDMLVHAGEPGAEHRETIASASEAAAAGGVTTLVLMPDTNPVIDDPALVDFIARRARDTAIVNVRPAAATTRGLEGRELSEYGLLLEAGAVALAQPVRPITDARVLRNALSYAKDFNALVMHQPHEPTLTAGGVMNEGEMASRLGLPGIPREAESIMLERDLALARLSGGTYHATAISCAASIAALARAKADGADVTAAATIAHLSLNEIDVGSYRTFFKVTPPLRSEDDRNALVEAVADGTVDIIVSAHRPQDVEGKRQPFGEAADGAVGLETSLSAGLRLVHGERLSMKRLIEAMSTAPARRLGLEAGTLAPGAPADLVVFDPDLPWVMTEDQLRSRSANTPFEGARFAGRVLRTLVAGRMVYEYARSG